MEGLPGRPAAGTEQEASVAHTRQGRCGGTHGQSDGRPTRSRRLLSDDHRSPHHLLAAPNQPPNTSAATLPFVVGCLCCAFLLLLKVGVSGKGMLPGVVLQRKEAPIVAIPSAHIIYVPSSAFSNDICPKLDRKQKGRKTQ